MTFIERLRVLRLETVALNERVKDFLDDAERAMGDRGGAWRPSDIQHVIQQFDINARLLKDFEQEIRRLRL